MSSNPLIILAGESPDLMGAFDRGQQAAARGNEIRRQKSLNALYQEHGPGILAGDKGAINALAGFDAMDALKVTAHHQNMAAQDLNMQATQQRMDMLTREEAQVVQDRAAQMTEAQRKAEAQRIEQGVAMGLAAKSPQEWDALMQSVAPELVGQFDQREMIANKFMSIKDVLERSQGPDLNDRFKVVGGSLFDLAAPGGPAPVGQGAMPEETIFGPDGKPIIQRGGPGSAVKFTEGQSKDNVFATRAEGALSVLDQVGADVLASRGQRAAEAVPFGLARGLQSEEFQQAQQAGDEFLQAILRKDTGAAITEGEQVLYGRTYLPQPGDTPAVIEAKRLSRIRAIEAIRAGMNPQQQLIVDRAQIEVAERAGAAPQPAAQQPATGAPEPGTIDGGYRFKGGDPSDHANWEIAR